MRGGVSEKDERTVTFMNAFFTRSLTESQRWKSMGLPAMSSVRSPTFRPIIAYRRCVTSVRSSECLFSSSTLTGLPVVPPVARTVTAESGTAGSRRAAKSRCRDSRVRTGIVWMAARVVIDCGSKPHPAKDLR